MNDQEIKFSSAEKHHFLAGGGEMGEYMRTKDWSKTPVGNPGTWPQSLRTTLSIILNSKFPMFLFWGADLVCFYNDAYRPSLGKEGKHPHILGSKGEDYWSEIWHIIKPLIDQVLEEGIATWSENQLIPIYRNGKLEDVYWTFSYSPVYDESGKPAGVFVTCVETTEIIISRKNLVESNDQLQFAIEATELATWDFDPGTNKFTSNNRLKEWFGLPAQAEIELADAVNIIAEKDRQRVTEAIQKSLEYTSGGNYDIEYSIVHPVTKKERVVQAKGKAWFNTEKIAYRFNGTIQDVTEPVIARKKIEESEIRFRTMAENSDILIAVSDETGKAVYFNNAWAKLTGRPTEQLLNFGWADLIYPEDRKGFIDMYLKALEKQESWTGELRILSQEGSYKWILAKAPPRFSMDGNFEGYISSSIDITERKEAEEALKASEKEFRDLADSQPELVWKTDINGKQIYASKRWKEFTGLDPSDEKTFNAVTHPDDIENVIRVWTESLQTGNPYKTELRLKSKEGEYNWFYANGNPVKNEKGEIEKWVGAFTNINDQKKAEEKLVTAIHSSEESEQRFQAAVHAIEGILWTNNAKGEMEGVQPAWEQLTGQTYNEYQGYGWAKAVHPDDAQPTIEAWENSVAENKNFIFQHRVLKKNGEYGTFSIRGIPLFNKNGTIREWVGVHSDITIQQKAEEKLRNSEQRFRDVANSAPVLIWMADTNKFCYFFNTAWLKFTGRTMEQEMGNGWAEGVHPEDVKRCIDIYFNAFDKREEFYIEYRLKRNDGEYRWISNNGVPRFTAEDNFEGFIGACMDIHDQVMHKARLEANEEKLNIVIEASDLGTWELDLKTKQPSYSDRYLEILGYPKDKKLSHAELLTHLHPDDLFVREKAFKTAVQTGSLYYQSRILWNDSSVHWFEAKGKVFYDELHKPVKMIGTIRDITDEKKYNRDLEEREQKFRILADFMPQFVWTGDAQGNLNYFNQAVYNYSGLTAEEVEKDGWLQIVHPDEREENVKAWIKSVTEGTDFIFEHRFKRYDGIYRWQLSRAIPQRDVYGNIQMWVGTSTDIQDIKEQDQQKDYFISMASHELKTPVTSIKGYVQILQSMYSNGEDTFLQNSLKIVDKQIITLTKLISELLDISKIKSGGLDFNKEDFEINNLVQEVVDEIKHINPVYDIPVSATGKVMVNGDRHRIGQVLINFLTNAVKYAPHSDTIKVISVMENNKVVISVEDSGIGISKKDQERIFERFYRVEGKNEKTFPGFGIGLFIASEIIRRHNGKINVISEPGKGSVFSFSLPVNL